MKRSIYIISGLLVAGFIIIQFYRPEKNLLPVTDDDLFIQMEISPQVEILLRNSCYDCHSNQTRYPWYNNIAPVSWLLANHINEGKEHLNFSEWGNLSKRKQIGMLNEICEVCETFEMPLRGYTKMHKDARLDAEKIKLICHWTETAIQDLLKK